MSKFAKRKSAWICVKIRAVPEIRVDLFKIHAKSARIPRTIHADFSVESAWIFCVDITPFIFNWAGFSQIHHPKA